MMPSDLICEVDEEIENEKKEKAKSILKAQRKHVDDLQNQADKATEKYDEMLGMGVDELIEKHGWRA